MQQTLTNNRTTNPSNFLRNTLFANAIFSTICALVFLVESRQVDEFMGLGNRLAILVIGAGLLFFAAELFWIVTRPTLDRKAAIIITGMDLLWVVGSGFVLASGMPALANSGWWAVAMVADIVALFAILEIVGLRRAGSK